MEPDQSKRIEKMLDLVAGSTSDSSVEDLPRSPLTPEAVRSQEQRSISEETGRDNSHNEPEIHDDQDSVILIEDKQETRRLLNTTDHFQMLFEKGFHYVFGLSLQLPVWLH